MPRCGSQLPTRGGPEADLRTPHRPLVLLVALHIHANAFFLLRFGWAEHVDTSTLSPEAPLYNVSATVQRPSIYHCSGCTAKQHASGCAATEHASNAHRPHHSKRLRRYACTMFMVFERGAREASLSLRLGSLPASRRPCPTLVVAQTHSSRTKRQVVLRWMVRVLAKHCAQEGLLDSPSLCRGTG